MTWKPSSLSSTFVRPLIPSIEAECFRSLRHTESLQTLFAAIRVMYENTWALVITPEGKTEQFAIDTGMLQGDPLAPFLFIICSDYALRSAITDSDGLTLKRRSSSRHPAVVRADLDYADDIALLENTIKSAQHLLNRVEKACQVVGFPKHSKNQIHAPESFNQQLSGLLRWTLQLSLFRTSNTLEDIPTLVMI